MLLKENGAYHPVSGLMPSPLQEVPEELGWYYEKWATPYMAAVAKVIFRRKPEVTLTPQPPPGEGLASLILSRLGLRKPDVTITPQVGAEKIIEGVGGYVPLPLSPIGLSDPELYPMPNSGTAKYYASLGFAPKLSEWFNKNRILVVVVIVALVLLFFFLKKGRR